MNSLIQISLTWNYSVVNKKIIYFHLQTSASGYLKAIIARVEPAKPHHRRQRTLLENPTSLWVMGCVFIEKCVPFW